MAHERGVEAYKKLKHMWHTIPLTSEKEIILRSLCSIQSPNILSDVFDFMLADVPAQDIFILTSGLAANTRLRKHFWKLIESNFDRFETALKGNMVLIERCLRVILESFTDDAMIGEIERFFVNRGKGCFDRMLDNVKDVILVRSGYRKRDLESVREWAIAYTNNQQDVL